MSFPPRPPVVFMSVPTIVPTMVNFTPVSFASVISALGHPQQYRPRQQEMRPMRPPQDAPASGPLITVFVGNITERAPDAMVRQMLTCCGPVVSWKRVQGASGVLQAFGFCEFASPESALRAIRVLHDWQIMERKLVVKVDAKTKTLLDEFKSSKVKEETGQSPKEGLSPGHDPFFTDEMRRQDEQVMRMVRKIVRDNEPAMLAMEVKKETKDRPLPVPGSRTQERLLQLSQGDSGLSDTNMEEGQKEFISKEIGKFREIMLRQEEEREVDRKRREAEKEKRRSPSPGNRRRRSPESGRSSRSPSSRRRGTPDAAARRRTSRSRSRDKENRREDDDERERRRLDKKAREKEMAYQERLRVWETRERKKSKEYEKEKKTEREKKSEETKLARRLKEFLEDYDDERDDPKYYKGRELERRRAERLREIESDTRDRQREKEELDELKSKIFAQGYENPDATFQKAILEMEEKYRPDILFKPEELAVKISTVTIEDRVPPMSPPMIVDSQMGPSTPSSIGARSADMDETSQSGVVGFTISPSNISSSPKTMSLSPMTSAPSTPVEPKGEKRLQPSTSSSSVTSIQKKKRLDISEVFNTEDDESAAPKRKKLSLLDDESRPSKAEKVSDDKKKHVKGIIERIPTDKAELFAFPMDWSLVDTNMIDKRIRPWINKKIIEYIGEPEPTLVEFICSKIMTGSSAQSILDDVQMVLDEEAEVFVVKMWRLLIYELEAKKNGPGK